MQVRLLGFIAILMPLFESATVRQEGDYHDGETLRCSECHVMHPRRSGAAQPAEELDPGQRGFVGELLREEVNDTCLACHDGSGRAVDVLGINQGRYPGDVRQAGHLNRLGRSGLPGTGHTLDSTEPAPGSDPPWSAEEENGGGRGLNCINCHAHHGSQAGLPTYRNLRPDAGVNAAGKGRVTYNHGSPGRNDVTRDVFVRQSLRYDETVVDFNEPDPQDSAMGRFCAGCHAQFYGIAGRSAHIGGAGEVGFQTRFLRHPGAGVDLGAGAGAWSSLSRLASRSNRVKVMSGSGEWNPPSASVTPTCITCHKAHGNDNAFGLIYRSGTGTLTENGDSGGGRLEHLCSQCHAAGDA